MRNNINIDLYSGIGHHKPTETEEYEEEGLELAHEYLMALELDRKTVPYLIVTFIPELSSPQCSGHRGLIDLINFFAYHDTANPYHCHNRKDVALISLLQMILAWLPLSAVIFSTASNEKACKSF